MCWLDPNWERDHSRCLHVLTTYPCGYFPQVLRSPITLIILIYNNLRTHGNTMSTIVQGEYNRPRLSSLSFGQNSSVGWIPTAQLGSRTW